MKQLPACAYCGNPATTVDHIPPQSLFPDGIDLITVPSCKDCGPTYERDDELFKIFLAKCGRSGNKVAEDHIKGSIDRCLKQHSPGLRKKIAKQTQVVEQVTPSGIIIGDAHVLEVTDEDWKRITGVLERIVKGYYFRLTGERHDGCRFLTLDIESPMFPEIMSKLPELQDLIISGTHFKTPDKTVFLGKTIVSSDNVYVWVLCFYEKKTFLVFQIKPN